MPTLTRIISRGSKNRLVRTEAFDQAAWSKTSVTATADQATDELGATTLDQLDDASAGVAGTVTQDVASGDLISGELYTFSVQLKKGTAAVTRVRLSHAGSDPSVNVDVTWGAAASDVPTLARTTGGSVDYAMSDVRALANNNFRVAITFKYNGSGALRCSILPAGNTAASTGTVFAGKAQFEESQAATAYVAVTGATDPLVGDFKTIDAAFAAHNAENFVSTTNKYIYQLRDELYELPSGSAVLSNSTATSTLFRTLTFVPSVGRYNPVTNTGPRVVIRYGASGTNAGIKIFTENFVTIWGIGFFIDYQTRPDAGTNYLIQVGDTTSGGSDSVRIMDCFFSGERGGGDTNAGNNLFFEAIHIDGTAGNKSDGVRIFNSIFKGGGPGSVRGLDGGVVWGGNSNLGGMYNCTFYGIVGHGSGDAVNTVAHASAVTAPEIVNCMACDCAESFVGFFSRNSNNITSDAQGLVSIAGKGFVSAVSVWLSPDQQDMRLRPGCQAIDAGSTETTIFSTANGGPGSFDITGNPRGSIWDIGAYEGATVDAPPSFSIVNKTVGALPNRNYRSLASAIADLPRSLYASNQKYSITCYDDLLVDEQGQTILLDYFNCITSPGNSIEIKADRRIDPRLQVGYRVKLVQDVDTLNYHRAVMWVTTPNLDISGIMLHQAATSAETRNCRGLELWSHHCKVDGLFFLFDGTYSRSQGGCLEIEGEQGLITNVVCRGSNTTGQGAPNGIISWQDNIGVQILHCDVYRIKGGNTGAQARGIMVAAGNKNHRVSGCAVFETATAGASGAVDFNVLTSGISMDHCFSSDSTAAGVGSQTSITATNVFNNPTVNDFRLKSGSIAINAGGNLSKIFGFDITGDSRYAPFDVGAYEGIFHSPLMVTPGTTSLHRLASCFEIIRADGVGHFFTSANEPLQHEGITYLPGGQTSASARRMDAGFREHNIEVLGAIVSGEIEAEDLAAGLFKSARITERLIDWRYPWTTPKRVNIYRVANTEYNQDHWRAELVGITALLDQRVGELIGVDCPYNFGDPDCQVVVAALSESNIAVTSVSDPRRQFDASAITGSRPDDYFGLGKVTWLSGANAGTVMAVKVYTQTNRRVRLMFRAPFAIAVADRFDLSPGCRKRFVLDCKTKFSNSINHGGRVQIPGTDRSLETPTR